jgi:hypothetical protein
MKLRRDAKAGAHPFGLRAASITSLQANTTWAPLPMRRASASPLGSRYLQSMRRLGFSLHGAMARSGERWRKVWDGYSAEHPAAGSSAAKVACAHQRRADKVEPPRVCEGGKNVGVANGSNANSQRSGGRARRRFA